MKKSKKRLLFFLISLLFVMTSALVGYIMAKGEPRIVEVEPSPTALAAGVEGANDSLISSGATITWIYEYDMCRHEITETSEAGKDLVGLSFTQLQEKYPDARIVSFEGNAVTLEKSFACYCPEHCILKKDGSELGLFRTRAGTDEQEKIQEYHIAFDNLSSDEKETLSIGREFSDMTDVGVYIEKLLSDSE
jgi:hypothetical protein